MADRNTRRGSGEDGTTLSELLVVMLLLGVVGAVTTVGIVQGFNAQLDATNVADTLDGTRIATQRVRDFVRGADEVCADSSATSLVLWTDDDDDGAVVDGELDIFELVTNAAGDEVFQRRVPLAGGDEVQLIRDDIINSAVFVYPDAQPIDQPSDLVCQRGVTVTNGASRTRTVNVAFEVESPDPSDPDSLTTSTTVQIRNAGLASVATGAPVADFTVTCPVGTETCSFDASASSDPDGVVTAWEWDFGDGNTGTGETVSHTYAVGDTEYDVTLTVTDDAGLTNTVSKIAKPGLTSGNAKPTAAFTVSCVGLICDFDGTSSSDPDGTIQTYAWDFGDGATASGATVQRTYGAEDDYAVSLTVTDDGGATDTEITTVTARNNVMRVETISATSTAVSDQAWSVTFTVDLSLTTTGTPGDGINISATIQGGQGGNAIDRSGSCSTDASGTCTIPFSSIPKQADPVTFTVTQVNDPAGDFVYDADQNQATTLEIGPSATAAAP